MRSAGAPQQPPLALLQQQQQAGGLKRVRSAWKMRPLLIGGRAFRAQATAAAHAAAALSKSLLRLLSHPLTPAVCTFPQTRSSPCFWRVGMTRCCTTTAASFTSGCRTARLVRGRAIAFARALMVAFGAADSRRTTAAPSNSFVPTSHRSGTLAGKADPADGFPYPLVVVDKDLRTLLEIKPGDQQPAAEQGQASVQALPAVALPGDGIIVPIVRVLPAADQPELLVRDQEPPVVQRMQALEQPDVVGTSAAALAASAAWRSAEQAVAQDPPYIRYVQVGRQAACAAGTAVRQPAGRARAPSLRRPARPGARSLPALPIVADPRRPGPCCGIRP